MAGPDPAVAAARTAVVDTLSDVKPGQHVIVACSGGADSLALAATVAWLAPRRDWKASAVVVDHQLREGSADEAAHVVRQLATIDLPATVVTTQIDDSDLGPEGGARQARYRALDDARTIAGHGAVVVLGHTLDDQAETVLLALARGSSLRNLAAMARRSGHFRRPLLTLRRADTEAVCKARGLEWVRDPTNAASGPWRAADGTALRRAAVRDHALPTLADALGIDPAPGLARVAIQARRDDEALNEVAAQAAARAISASDSGVTIRIDDIADLHPAVRTRIIRQAGHQVGWNGSAIKAVHVEEIDALIANWHGQGPIQVPGGVLVRREYGNLLFTPVPPSERRTTSHQ